MYNSLVDLTNRQKFSVLLSTLEMTSEWSKLISRRKIIVDFFFNNNIDSFVVHFRRSFPENRAFEKEKSKLRHHHVISIVCTLIKHSSRPIKARNSSVIEKIVLDSFWTVREYCANFLVQMAIPSCLTLKWIYAVPLRTFLGLNFGRKNDKIESSPRLI